MDIKDIHRIELDMLSKMKEIVLKHDFHFMLAYGSMLGAIRDGGIIPWDTDVDILIDTDSYEKICKTLYDELPDQYTIIDQYSNDSYELLFSRICLKNDSHKVVHIDLFRAIGTPNNLILKYTIMYLLKYLSRGYYIKKAEVFREKVHVKLLFAKILLFWLPSSFIRFIYKHIVNKLSICDKKEIFNSVVSYGMTENIPVEWYKELKEVAFGNLTLPISKHYDSYLKHFYNDYWVPRKENYANK